MKRDTSNDQALPTLEVEQATHLPVLLHAGGGASYLPVLLHTGGGAGYPPASPPPRWRWSKLLTCQSSSTLEVEQAIHLPVLLHAGGGASCLSVLLHVGGGASCPPASPPPHWRRSKLPASPPPRWRWNKLPTCQSSSTMEVEQAACQSSSTLEVEQATHLPVLLHAGGGASYPPASPPPHWRWSKLLTCQSSSRLLLGLRLRLSSLRASWCTRTARCLHTCTQCINIHTPAKAPPHARSMVTTKLYKPCLQR